MDLDAGGYRMHPFSPSLHSAGVWSVCLAEALAAAAMPLVSGS